MIITCFLNNNVLPVSPISQQWIWTSNPNAIISFHPRVDYTRTPGAVLQKAAPPARFRVAHGPGTRPTTTTPKAGRPSAPKTEPKSLAPEPASGPRLHPSTAWCTCREITPPAQTRVRPVLGHSQTPSLDADPFLGLAFKNPPTRNEFFPFTSSSTPPLFPPLRRGRHLPLISPPRSAAQPPPSPRLKTR